jgi:hypothetical protein
LATPLPRSVQDANRSVIRNSPCTSVGDTGHQECSEIPPRRLDCQGGASVVAARCHKPNGGSQCQNPRRSERLHYRQRSLPLQSPHDRPRYLMIAIAVITPVVEAAREYPATGTLFTHAC